MNYKKLHFGLQITAFFQQTNTYLCNHKKTMKTDEMEHWNTDNLHWNWCSFRMPSLKQVIATLTKHLETISNNTSGHLYTYRCHRNY